MRKKVVVLIAILAVALVGVTFGVQRTSCPLPRRDKKQSVAAKPAAAPTNSAQTKALDR